MEPFVRVDQYQYIRKQLLELVRGYQTANDKSVQGALKTMALERMFSLFPAMTKEQEDILKQVSSVNEKEEAERFLLKLKSYIIPFQITEDEIINAFPKMKKLKVPALQSFDLTNCSYISWIDQSKLLKFIVTRRDGYVTGTYGTMEYSQKTGVCAICKSVEKTGLFLVKEKGKEAGTYRKKGNYICVDSQACNQNLTSLSPLYEFLDTLRK
ncbi:fibronectin-binding family protein [Gracilibacillus halophilus YIM-C55.5]|uniref:Fibronectin-binding family protein n=1 Tax=Gracilibacillus halophilus YIM-C55.5 TaxID=1308866 RepID=N4WAM8_9BACI|nr:elongation factor G-binding protein [Gracilibacillus halophilus]ENH96324.1 fibronectin-binding family protein [Gracilibacillus halophilus YIM-C55.5]